MPRKIAFLFAVLSVYIGTLSAALGQELRLRIGGSTNGFHLPMSYHGRTITVRPPENEHMAFDVEDIYRAAGMKLDVFIGQAAGINNAFAVVNADGFNTRRFIVIDPSWSYRLGDYTAIIAHEIAHHVCGHTLSDISKKNRWAMELEADQAAGALLRKLNDSGRPIDLTFSLQTISRLGPGSATHPPAHLRTAAYMRGWTTGSSCLARSYNAINPFPKPPYRDAVERIFDHYSGNMIWWYRYSFLKSERTKRGIRMALHRPSKALRRSGGSRGATLFEGRADKEKILGQFWAYRQGCPPVTYKVQGNFTENNGIFLSGHPPLKYSGCKVVEWDNRPWLHYFKNTRDHFTAWPKEP